MERICHATVGSTIRYLLQHHPQMWEPFENRATVPAAIAPPELPTLTDAFAVAAFLVKQTGLSAWVDPISFMASTPYPFPDELKRTAAGDSADDSAEPATNWALDRPDARRNLRVSPKVYKRVEKIRKRVAPHLQEAKSCVRKLLALDSAPATADQDKDEEKIREDMNQALDRAEECVEKNLAEYWHGLLACWDDPLTDWSESWSPSVPLPSWWQAALDLMVFTDMLCEGLLSPHDWYSPKAVRSYPAFVFSMTPGEGGVIRTFSPAIPPEIAVVMPKAHTPNVGSSVRSLSQNLALLPAAGTTRTQWDWYSSSDREDRTPLNILLIPIPYFIHASAFEPGIPYPNRNWNFFEIKDNHGEEVSSSQVRQFVRSLVEQAAGRVDKIDAIVFPECALTSEQFSALAEEIRAATPEDPLFEIEFMVSGTTDKQTEEGLVKGNFVSTASFVRSAIWQSEMIELTTAKHHRWKLEGGQIETYRLSHVLNQGMSWWENLPPGSREMIVHRFRNDHTFMTLICEDLARIDPGQEIVRSIGPDLLIAILMDSAQIDSRWPARYATIMSDDPGTSVLTLTSYALVQRANSQRRHTARADKREDPVPSRSIGLWKDPIDGGARVLELARNAEAMVITIASQPRAEATLDGRYIDGFQRWRWSLTDVRQVIRPIHQQKDGPAFGRKFRDDSWCLMDCEDARDIDQDGNNEAF